MKNLANYNRQRWNALAEAGIQYSRPMLDLDAAGAREWLASRLEFAHVPIPEVAGKDVFCLASGGGQQTAVFGLLGANVTVLDLSDAQLERDRKAAERHGYGLTAVQGDMRDLSRFSDGSFDLIYHAFSINFVPEAAQVIAEAGRVIRSGGLYKLDFANPFWTMEESDWTEKGYPVRQPYITGKKHQFTETSWDVEDEHGTVQKVEGPHEFMHTLSAIFNGLLDAGFQIVGFKEGPPGDGNAPPGSWEHLLSIIPPFLSVATIKK